MLTGSLLAGYLLVLLLGPLKAVCNKVHRKAAIKINVLHETFWLAVK
jgi:hypothetical protein